jgi:hypothetical protein
MIDEVMFEIREMTGQEYRNVYAGSTAESEPTVPAKVATVNEPEPLVVSEFELVSAGAT